MGADGGVTVAAAIFFSSIRTGWSDRSAFEEDKGGRVGRGPSRHRQVTGKIRSDDGRIGPAARRDQTRRRHDPESRFHRRSPPFQLILDRRRSKQFHDDFCVSPAFLILLEPGIGQDGLVGLFEAADVGKKSKRLGGKLRPAHRAPFSPWPGGRRIRPSLGRCRGSGKRGRRKATQFLSQLRLFPRKNKKG